MRAAMCRRAPAPLCDFLLFKRGEWKSGYCGPAPSRDDKVAAHCDAAYTCYTYTRAECRREIAKPFITRDLLCDKALGRRGT